MSKQRILTDAEILAQIPAARKREVEERKAGLRATAARYDRATHRVLVDLTNGYLFGFPVRAIAALTHATPAQLAKVTVLPGGSGLAWDALDVDLSVPGLLMASMDRAQQASELARLAGSTKSAAKTRTARENGAKGGRPRKRKAA
jgi:hypothetical protein